MKRLLLALTLVALALPATAAAAPDTVINFEGLPYSTPITNQYANQGITFGYGPDFGFPKPDHACNASASGPGAGINGTDSAIISCQGSAEISPTYAGISFEFNTERREVSFNLEQAVESTPQEVEVTFLGIGGTQLYQKYVTLPDNTPVAVSYDHGVAAGGIVGIEISGQMDGYATGRVYLDDIDATQDDTPPPPKFALALDTPSLSVVEGSTAQATVSVRRYNGSTGAVNLSLGSLPSGITAANLSPTTVSGTDPVALNVTAASPFTGTDQLTINASGSAQAGTAVVGTGTETVTGVPAVTINAPSASPLQVVASCGAQTFTGYLQVAGNYTGTVAVHVDASGLAVGQPAPVSVNGNGAYPFTYTLSPTYESDGKITITATPAGATPATQTVPYTVPAVIVSDQSLTAPVPFLAGESTLTLHGSFPAGCPLRVYDTFNNTWPIVNQTPSTLTVDVSPIGPSGPLLLDGPAGPVEQTVAVSLTQFRLQDGLSQANSGAGAGGPLSWDDFVSAFPDSRFVDCSHNVCIHDPLSEKYYERYEKDIASDNGLCFGYSVMASRFARGLAQPADYKPGATRAWDITPTADGTAIKRAVIRWQLSEDDVTVHSEFSAADQLSPAAESQRLNQELAQHGTAMVTIAEGGEGHELVAYGVTDLGKGSYRIHIYDPNLPFVTTEDTKSGVLEYDRGTSSIVVNADGSWKGTSLGWSGDNSTLGVLPDLPPEHPRLYDTRIIGQTVGAAAGAPDPAAVNQITIGGVPQLTSSGVPKQGSDVQLDPELTGSGTAARYVLPEGHATTLNVRGSSAGTYSESVLGDGTASVLEGAHTGKGQTDQVTVTPGVAALGFATGASSSPATLELDARGRAATEEATIALTGRHGASDHTALKGGSLTLDHTGASETASVTFGAVGSGGASSATLAPMRLGHGERLTLTPGSWRDPASGVRFVVRSAGGKIIRHGHARVVPSRDVRLGSVAARTHGSRVVISGRVARAGADPVLSAVVQVVAHRKVVRTRTARRTTVHRGKFTLTVKPGKVPHGAKLRVTVQLLDQAASAGLATAARTVMVR